MNLVNQLRQFGEDFSYQRVVEKVLRILRKKFEVVVVYIEDTKYIAQMHIDKLTRSLVAHESMMTRYAYNAIDPAFKS